MGLYDAAMNLANTLNCSLDEAMAWGTFGLMVFFALIGWAMCFCADYGMAVYELTKRLFRFLRKITVKLFRRLRRRFLRL